MTKKQLPPEVLAACMQRGIPPSEVRGFEVTDVDVFLSGPTGILRIEISALPEPMLELFRTQQVQVAEAPKTTRKKSSGKKKTSSKAS